MYMSVLILNREQVKQVISMKEVIQEVREVYRLKSQGKSVIWPLVNYEFVDEHAAMDIRSGYIKGVQLHGLKMLNNFPENREKGLPPFNGIMMVYDSNTGIPVSVMDASYVTCMRTGAAGALGVDLLARKDARWRSRSSRKSVFRTGMCWTGIAATVRWCCSPRSTTSVC